MSVTCRVLSASPARFDRQRTWHDDISVPARHKARRSSALLHRASLVSVSAPSLLRVAAQTRKRMIKKKEERQQILKEHSRAPGMLGPQYLVPVGQSWHIQVAFALLSARALAQFAACRLMHPLV